MKQWAGRILLASVILFCFYQLANTFTAAAKPVNLEESEYANNLLSDTISVYENTVTDKRNDFFILTSKGEFFAEITKDNGVFSEKVIELSEDTEKLNEMSELSMKDESVTSKNNTHFFFLPGL